MSRVTGLNWQFWRRGQLKQRSLTVAVGLKVNLTRAVGPLIETRPRIVSEAWEGCSGGVRTILSEERRMLMYYVVGGCRCCHSHGNEF